MTQEEKRLEENRIRKAYWRRWGPYLSERRGGYSARRLQPHGTAWDYFRSCPLPRLSLGEDGIAEFLIIISDFVYDRPWNGEDPILKERLFGVLARRVFGVSHRSN